MTAPAVEGSTFYRDLLVGFAELLRDLGLGTYNPNVSYTATQTGIFFLASPDTPDRQIVLTPWTVSDNPDDAMSVAGLQVRTRAGANPIDVMTLDDRIYVALHNRTNFTLSTGVRIAQSLRRSSAALGQDASRRWSWSSNYYLDAHRPAPNRT
jgi:hypothetical protein